MKKSLLIPALLAITACSTYAQTGNVGIGTPTPASKLSVMGSMSVGYTATSSASYTILDNDYYIVWTGTSGYGYLTLPAATAAKKGRVYKIKNNSTLYNLYILTTNSVNIDGASSMTLPPGSGAEIIANGNTASNSTAWEVVGAISSSATVSTSGASSGNIGGGGTTCTPAPVVSGVFTQGIQATNQTATVVVNVTQPGSYTVATNVVNGLHFEASGIFTATGYQTVVLFARGTPTAGGNLAFSFSYGASACTFSTPVTGFTCGSAIISQSPTGALTASTAYSGTYTIPYTNGNGQSYGSTSQTISGLTLTRTAGTYAAGSGNVVYTLSGTYTGSAASLTFTLPECSGGVTFGNDGIRNALAVAGCASCAAYNAAAVDDWVQVTSAEYAAVANTANISNAVKGGASDADMTMGGGIGRWHKYFWRIQRAHDDSINELCDRISGEALSF